MKGLKIPRLRLRTGQNTRSPPASPTEQERRPSAQLTTLAYEDQQRIDAPLPSDVRRQRAAHIVRALAPGEERAQALMLCDREQPPVIEYLAVCGLRSASDPASLCTLACRPEDARTPPELPRFCFPDRSPQCAPIVASDSRLAPDAHELQSGQNKFMLCLMAQHGAPLYVYVVRSWEMLEQPPVWLPVDCVQSGSLLGARHLTERAYCIVTRNPYAELMWPLLERLAYFERRRLTSADNAEQRRQSERQRILVGLIDKLPQQRCVPGSPFVLRSRGCFPHGGELLFNAPAATSSLRASIAETCLPALIRAFSPDKLVLLLTAALTETKVVFVGQAPGRVAACVMALTAAIAPFSWQGALMPLVPPSARDYLQAPVPALLGVATGDVSEIYQLLADDDSDAGNSCTVVADVDGNLTRVYGAILPQLPSRGTLTETLSASHLWLREQCEVDEQKRCTDLYPFRELDAALKRHVVSAVEALNQYTVWLLSAVRAHLENGNYGQRSPDDQALITELVQRVQPQNAAFVELLLNTQHYQTLAETFCYVDPSGHLASAYRDSLL